ncbi:uncharacterized protein LOC134197597 isoform X2 [Corticium candelabrum]|uniref:uncharacterized protein LOC134197597 isoform X2 n=1 Tax=Corticium candelabrum TaxID=121492 RepID=UPI002E2709F4|nr:uncharacterized protein LOC134197597 isoform X2 [Corticium candelabrum]
MTEDVGVPFSYVPSSAPLPNGVRLVDGNDALLRGKRRKGKSKVLDKVAWFTRKSGESSSKTKHKRESVKRKELQQNDSSSDSSSNGELVHDDSWLYEEEEHVHIENTSNSFEGQQSYVPIVSHVTEGSPSVRARAAVFGPLVRRLSEDANALPSWNRLGALSAGSNYTNHSNLLSSTASLNTVPRVLKNARATAVSTRSQSLFSSLPFLPYAVAKEADPFSDKEVCHCPACCGCRHQSTLELNSKTSGLFQENSLGQRLNSWPRRDCPLRKQLQQLKRDTSPLSGSDESKRTGESDSGISEIDLSPKHQKPDIDATEVKYRMQQFEDQRRRVLISQSGRPAAAAAKTEA